MKFINEDIKYVFGGYIKNDDLRLKSTSGGAYSAIVEAYCDENYVIFGAAAEGLDVFHTYITDKEQLNILRKSKYSQSRMGDTFNQVKEFLQEGKKVLFSGTPCQIAGLKLFLKEIDAKNLLTVEVVCEGVPSPLYIKKLNAFIKRTYGSQIVSLDYRNKGRSIFGNGKWDFEIMEIILANGKIIKTDRWFNPFWNIWIGHLMSRPSCNECPFASNNRTADITLGDLWGVHLYCPELYGNNKGSSIVFCNSDKGVEVFMKAKELMIGHELDLREALRYQSPMRKHIEVNPNRETFMSDLKSEMSYEDINNKWSSKPTFNLLWNKYVWGNRQKVWLWNLTNGKFKIK